VLDGLRTEPVTQIWGECGIGKTSLLRHVAHRATAEFGDWPVVYLSAAGQPLEDLLQSVHHCLYQSPKPAKLGQAALRAELRRARSVLLLDDVALSAADLAEMLRSLQESRIVLTSPIPRCDGCRSIELNGLEEPAAIELLGQGLEPRGLRDDELDDARRLCEALRGHPLRLLQAAALVRAGRQDMHQLAAGLGRGDPADLLARECQAGLSPEQRKLIAALALAAGAFLPTNLVEDMCQVAFAASKLRELRDRHVIDERRDRFGLPACSIGEPRELVRKSLERGLAMHGLVQWLQHPGTSPDEILSVSHSLLTVVEIAAESGDWQSVLDIVHAVEPVLIVSGHWMQWRYAEESALHAADQLDDGLERAYHLHELGSRALALKSDDQARPLLEEARSLRRHGPSSARRVTVHNLGLILRPAWWRQARTAAAAAAAAVAVLVIGGLIALARPEPGPPVVPASPPSVTASSTPAAAPAPSRSSTGPSPSQSSVPTSPSATPPAPIITRIVPARGPAAGGTGVTISGSGFAGTTAVAFGNVEATNFTVDSSTQVSAVTPPGTGAVDVSVRTPGGSSATTTSDLFTYIPAPVVTGIEPPSGPPSGGTQVKIFGGGFAGATSVSFRKSAATTFNIVSDSQIIAVSPLGSGDVDVTVTGPGGTSMTGPGDLFSYVAIG
jgi:hypothetical protein